MHDSTTATTQTLTRDQLSPRELDVLRGFAVGESRRQTGNRLYLAEDTVKTYSVRVLRKLRARNRAHAVAIGMRANVI